MKNLTTHILSKEIVAQNQSSIDVVSQYSHVSSLIERTRIAMGKKKAHKNLNSLNSQSYKNTADKYGTKIKNNPRI